MSSATPILVPELATSRLLLLPIGPQHSTGMFQLWSDPLVCRYSGAVHDAAGNLLQMPAVAVGVSDKILEFWLAAVKDGWGFRWAVLLADSQTFIGTLGFNALTPCAELAYHQLPSHWGKGYMSEAATVALDWVEQTYRPVAVEAFIEPANTGSVALIERLGFAATQEVSDGARRYIRPKSP